MIKTEIFEIKKQFTHDNCGITKICACYVDGEKNIKTKLSEIFLCLPEEETFKYFEIFKKTLSGTIGKNLINMEFPTHTEFDGGQQEFLMKLRESKLKDEEILDEFYNKIIQMYEYTGNYLILLFHAAYDVPGKGKDKFKMEDASEEVYTYILCSICPVILTKPGLSYNSETNLFQNRIQDWVVDSPNDGFLFPAFNDRSTDIHSILYYSKDSDVLKHEFIDQLFGCEVPMSAGGQKKTFQALIEETLGEECEFEIVRNIHDNLNKIIEEHKDVPEPLVLDKAEIKGILSESGADDEKLKDFEANFEEKAGDNTSLMASNVASTRVFEIKTPDIIIKVNPEYSSMVETKIVDGKKCLVIEMNDNVEVNGIHIR